MVYPVGICSDPRRHFGTASEKADLKKKRESGWLLVDVGCILLFLPWVLTCRNGRIPLVLSKILVILKLPLLDWYDWCMIMTSQCWFDLLLSKVGSINVHGHPVFVSFCIIIHHFSRTIFNSKVSNEQQVHSYRIHGLIRLAYHMFDLVRSFFKSNYCILECCHHLLP